MASVKGRSRCGDVSRKTTSAGTTKSSINGVRDRFSPDDSRTFYVLDEAQDGPGRDCKFPGQGSSVSIPQPLAEAAFVCYTTGQSAAIAVEAQGGPR